MRQGNNGNHGAKGKSGRKPRNQEQEHLAAFESVVSPKKFKEMTRELLAMFYREEVVVYDKKGRMLFKPSCDASTRARIWEKFAAYVMGEPKQRIDSDLGEGTAELLREFYAAAARSKTGDLEGAGVRTDASSTTGA